MAMADSEFAGPASGNETRCHELPLQRISTLRSGEASLHRRIPDRPGRACGAGGHPDEGQIAHARRVRAPGATPRSPICRINGRGWSATTNEPTAQPL